LYVSNRLLKYSIFIKKLFIAHEDKCDDSIFGDYGIPVLKSGNNRKVNCPSKVINMGTNIEIDLIFKVTAFTTV